jgi:hypothetical protein
LFQIRLFLKAFQFKKEFAGIQNSEKKSRGERAIGPGAKSKEHRAEGAVNLERY